MSRADVLQLVQDISAEQSDDTEATRFYDDVVRDLGFYELLTDAESKTYSPHDDGLYQMSPDAMRILEIAWNKRRLDRASEFALRALYGASWQLKRQDPVAVTEWSESAGLLRLAPWPTQPGVVDVIKTQTRENLPYWLELPVALMIIGREFRRESNHQDIKFADAANELGALFLMLLGVQVQGAAREQEQR